MCKLYEQLHTNGAADKLNCIKTYSQIFKARCVWYLWMNVQDMVVLKTVQLDTIKLKVCKSVHRHAIRINQPIRCNNFSSLLLDVYVQLNMFRAS
jgi:hypothetical protein